MKQQVKRVILLMLVMVFMLSMGAQAAVVRGLICYGGPIDDQGFNLMAYEGMKKAVKSYAPTLYIDTFVNKKADKLVAGDITLLSNKENFVIGLGDVYLPIFAKIAPKMPNTKFIVIDGDRDMKLANLLCIKFNDQEVGFLAGVAAGASTKSKNIGFIGGYKNLRANQDLLTGYKKGADYVNPAVKVQSDFVGSFTDPAKMTKKALQMYNRHADVIFQAAGKSGLGLFTAAAKVKKLAIGCDTDQSALVPFAERPYILTSVVKRIDSVVFTAIGSVVNGGFTPGLQTEDCSTGGVSYVDNAGNKAVLARAQTQLLDVNAKLTLKALQI
ncbi:MAG: BMP family ABC transporter substrate-binding protein [Acidaminococcaceae bacterium]